MPTKNSPLFTVIIPARYESHRFPGKVLARIAGKSMLQYVYEQACRSQASSIYIATDDERIAAAAADFEARIIMTSRKLASGTERVFAAASALQLGEDSLIVNVQGDEPLLPPENINQVAAVLNKDMDMASLLAPIENDEQLKNENCVKVVSDHQGRALYFSRAVIPHSHSRATFAYWQRHIGIYAYRMGFLNKYVHWKPCAAEKLEQLEQLRALYYGATIQLAVAQTPPPPGIDTPADLKTVEELLIQYQGGRLH